MGKRRLVGEEVAKTSWLPCSWFSILFQRTDLKELV